MHLSFKRAIAARALLFAVVCVLSLPTTVHTQDANFDADRIRRATVFVMQVDTTGASPIIQCAASGTLVTRTGLILTNAHPTVPNNACPGDDLIIAIASEPDAPPVPTFRASIVQSNPGLDIALLQIDRQIDGRLIDPTALSLPFVELADSDSLALDDTLVVVGYADLGDSSVSLVRGTVTGFSAEPIGGDRAWIKTNTVLPGTMTGTGAYDQSGRLVGIPTTVPLDQVAPDSRCLSLQDTNDDGVITSGDRCVPLGGEISVLRPSNFARPLFRAATLRLDLQSQTATVPFTAPTGAPVFSRLFFSPTVNDAGMPVSVVRGLPAGTDRVYLFFTYANMTSETVYELRVSSGGVLNPTFSLSAVRWSGGRDGLWYVGSGGQPWSNGVYDFTLLIG
ncbi:MAG: serine protease, partial [Chloroflexota bacterium]|nr:serine protease [Chloroflexota bacterium]